MLKRSVILIAFVLLLHFPQVVARPEQPAKPTVQEEPKSYDKARTRTRQSAGVEKLKRIGLALHGYHDIFGRFPPPVLYGPDGKTPYSWRVELLPVLKHYVDGIDPDEFTAATDRADYNALIAGCGYDIRQPWDSETNRSLLKAIPAVYRHPNDKPNSVESAYYAIVGSGTAFAPNDVAGYESTEESMTGWPATTLMVVESQSREPWTKPIDIAYSPTATVPRFGGFLDNGFLALAGNGAVHFVSDAVLPDDLRAFISKDVTDKFDIVGVPYRYK